MRILTLFGALVVFGAWLRARFSSWGADGADAARAMLGDDFVASPHVVTNRAITIDAAPADIWPWLVQMGDAPRGGYYSYAIVERLLGMKIRNADEILPQFRRLEVGDALDAWGNMRVRAIAPYEHLVLGPPELPQFDSTWVTVLYPQSDGRTHVVSRVRARYKRWTPANIVLPLVLDPGQLIMERKWLLGLKERAERQAKANRSVAFETR